MKHSFKFAVQYIKKYNKKSIFFNYLWKLFLLISIPILIILTSVCYYYQATLNLEIKVSSNTNFEKASTTINRVFEELTSTALYFSQDDYINMFLFSNADELISNSRKFIFDVQTQVRRFANSSKVINSIYLYSPESNYVYSEKSGSGFADSFKNSSWYGYYKETGNANFIIYTNDFHNSSTNLYISFGLYTSHGSTGLLVFEISPNTLDSLLLGNYSPQTDDFYIVDDLNQVIYSSSHNTLLPTYSEKSLSLLAEGRDTFYRKGDTISLARILNTSPTTKLIYVNNLGDLYDNLLRISILFFICIIVAITIPFIISIYITSMFYKSIVDIVSALNVDNPESNSEINEFSFITTHIMQLINKNKDAEAELIQKTAAFKQAQSVALQNQLNPHFLFNTLNLISLSSKVTTSDNSTSTLVSLLADILSYALDTSSRFATVEKEISYAKKYIEIQGIKHKNLFECQWNIDETILHNQTIKMILQPLIENSFQHGMSFSKKAHSKISISAKDEGSHICFCVADNGKKIPDDKLLQIREYMETEDLPKKSHIGLANIYLRIKLIYGDNCSMKIKSDDSGTSTYITFPKE